MIYFLVAPPYTNLALQPSVFLPKSALFFHSAFEYSYALYSRYCTQSVTEGSTSLQIVPLEAWQKDLKSALKKLFFSFPAVPFHQAAESTKRISTPKQVMIR